MSNITWRLLIGAFLIAHGLIHTAYGTPPPPPGPVKWPFDLSHSWLLSNLGVGSDILRSLGTVLWLATALAFAAAGLGVFGLPGLHTWWRTIALLASAFSLVFRKETSMSKAILITAVIVLLIHGLIHLMGTTVYMKLGTIEGMSYKTTLLSGHWDLGDAGIGVYGALWAVATIGFVAAAVALFAGWGWWQPMLVSVTLFSLVLTALDWSNAFAGVIINIVILAMLWIGPRITSWFAW
jgi:hypothetical protein